ncbi:sugar ABC transporter ATP-binding protein [Rhizobium sp. Root1203]|uniref:ABC transporter ATP-binding protein n=1 Tax=Rhizobium sp. Root1203 TaxID=1736427 RepID=UPI00070D930C|nr:sn-glycerol-3-phosphate ABC transporter ATP-binding protein UgpC [Rhizobium sp. Root1203]KQV12258.1 sugar ABC transporter ATP-binding protein [Rhizobium sp. Root1203]
MAPVTIQGIKKVYGTVKVVHGVNIEVANGEFVVLVGPSGCGKSTLLRMVAGLEGITEGEILIGGRVVNSIPPKERDVAMVFQNYALYPHMTVAENMGFSLKLAARPKADIDRRVAGAASILGLEKLLDRLPKQLSGGQRQRVAMGRAIVRDPQVFLFDEPLSNLDAKLRVQMRTEIKALHQRLGTTTIYVTHDQVEAMTMADKIVVMRDGVVEQIGSPLDLYDRPQNVFVAAFIGSPAMNMLSGRLIDGGFAAADGVRFACDAQGQAREGQKVVFGIRPEHIDLHEAGVEARVIVVEQTGSEVHVATRIGDNVLNCVFRERISLQPGETIKVLPRAGHGHLFDEASGQRCNAQTSRKALDS